MASIFDVAGFILEHRESTTAWQLQKLCYYSKAWSLALNDDPIFSQRFGARANGPVCTALYNKHSGRRMVYKDMFNYDISNLNGQEKAVILAVLDKYGDMTGDELSELTHTELPWQYARRGLPSDDPGRRTVIGSRIMKYYYITQLDQYSDMEDRMLVRLADERVNNSNKVITLAEALAELDINAEDLIPVEEVKIE